MKETVKDYEKKRSLQDFSEWVADLAQARINGLSNYIDLLGRKKVLTKSFKKNLSQLCAI